MNIREIEQQLGIPRANVRYYEKEGLLHPQRRENNYRDYTDEDVETLKKIRLLRQLEMPVDTIRAVQAGEVSLEEALSRQSLLLEGEAARVDQAREMCRSMLDDHATYPALDPARYERAASLPPRQASPAAAEPSGPPVEGAVWAYSPWQRFWARTLDLNLASCAVTAALSLAFHYSSVTSPGLLFDIVSLLLSWFVMLLVEPLLLSTWGTTPGKWLLGLELRTRYGRTLGYSDALIRTWRVLGQGYGYNIPIYNFYRQYKSYQLCRGSEAMDYDWEEGYLYYSLPGDRWAGRAVISVALSLALLAPLEVFVGYQALLPSNRGDVTAAEFYENMNEMSGYLGMDLWLDEEGRELADWSGTLSANGGPAVTYRYGEPISDVPVCTVETDENGYVTAVCLEREGAGEDAVSLPVDDALLAVMSLRGTEGTGLGLTRSKLVKALSGETFFANLWDQEGRMGVSVRDGKYTLSASLESEGYRFITSGYLMLQDDAQEAWYRFSIRLEKAK